MAVDQLVTRKIGQKNLQMPSSHSLLSYLEQFPFYDRALPRICKKVKEINGKLSVIDVGANIGDSVALITDYVQGAFLCIEGDKEYVELLKQNTKLSVDSSIEIEEAFCAGEDGVSDVLRVDKANGTARLTPTDGKIFREISLKRLDTIVLKHPKFQSANLLKIDTDGFEYDVLNGGNSFIRDAKPVIYFEFTPKYYLERKLDPIYIFRLIGELGYKNALIYDNFGRPIEIVRTDDVKRIEDLIKSIDGVSIYYYDVLTYNDSLKDLYGDLFETELLESSKLARHELDKNFMELTKTRSDYSELQLKNTQIKAELIDVSKDNISNVEKVAKIKAKLKDSEVSYAAVKNTIDMIYASRSWGSLMYIQSLIRMLLPRDSFRRKVIRKLWQFGRRVVSRIYIEGYSFRIRAWKAISPPRPRNINPSSKKIVYVGHSYHAKTKSTLFLIDYLREHYDVTVVLDDSWQGKPFPDLSFVDSSYHAVLFFQNLPSSDIFNRIKNDNKIFFPMFDAQPKSNYSFLLKYKNIKVINFSNYTHLRCKKFSIDSIHVKYFPDSGEFAPGAQNEVFFWQRVTNINIHTLTTLFENEKVKIHIHKAVDPSQMFVKPTKNELSRFTITYSDWFENREEMWNLALQKGLYISPRVYEGIGLSFLEAMALGKAVVAVNNPTMNEYIIHGKTGYLYDVDNLEPLDLSSIKQVQKNAYDYMKKNIVSWELDKKRIIYFISQI